MWISKEEWNEISKKMAKLERRCINNEEYIERIMSIIGIKYTVEKEKRGDYGDMMFRQIEVDSGLSSFKSYFVPYYLINKSFVSVNTDSINDITLSELAKFVLDGTPIKRTRQIDVEYHP